VVRQNHNRKVIEMGIDAEMFVKTTIQFTDDEVLDLAYDLASSFGENRFFIKRPGDVFGDESRHCLEIIEEYYQDGPTLKPANGETFIRVYLWGRYYGEGYERGDLPLYINVAEWLESRIPNAEVFYGGDSSGVCAMPFNNEARMKLWKYFCQVNHAPYYFDKNDDGTKRPVCDLCKKPLHRYGWGRGFAAFSCSGCSLDIETPNKGETFYHRSKNGKDEDERKEWQSYSKSSQPTQKAGG
jgi:hypothetical protein